MTTPTQTHPPSNARPALPEKLLMLSIHHLARLLCLLPGPQPSLPGSTEQALDTFLLHLGLVAHTPQSRPGWVMVCLSFEGLSLVRLLLDMALPPLKRETPAENSSPAPSSAPTPTPPPPSVKPPRPARLSLVHSRD
ncbi:MAG: hypothetical protein RLY71_466 [Pseudomonadota bacterium]|jgi:hypothetical protein